MAFAFYLCFQRNLQPSQGSGCNAIYLSPYCPLAPTSNQNAFHRSHLYQLISENAHRHGEQGSLDAGCLQEQHLGSLKASQGVLIHHVLNLHDKKSVP